MPSPSDAASAIADRAASDCLASGDIGEKDILHVLDLLFVGRPRQDRRVANPEGRSTVAGGVIGSASFGPNAYLKKNHFNWNYTRHVARLLNTWRDVCCGIKCADDDQVRATSIQINRCTPTEPGVDLHIDSGNYGQSDFAVLGDFKGGRFFCESSPGEEWTHERDLVVQIGQQRLSTVRTPGIYRGCLHDARNSFVSFCGTTHLHRGERTLAGVRYSLIWYSVGRNNLRHLDEYMAELRRYGFRPLHHAEAPLPHVPERLENDVGFPDYPGGFLAFCRHHRWQVEREDDTIDPKFATPKLWDRWLALGRSDAEGEQGYWAAIERLARMPEKKRRNYRLAMREDGDRGHAAGADAPPGPGPEDRQELIHVSDSEQAQMNDSELNAFAEVVCEEYPRVYDDMDLFINVLGVFGVEDDPEVRARVWHRVSQRRSLARDEALAVQIQDSQASDVSDGSSDESVVAGEVVQVMTPPLRPVRAAQCEGEKRARSNQARPPPAERRRQSPAKRRCFSAGSRMKARTLQAQEVDAAASSAHNEPAPRHLAAAPLAGPPTSCCRDTL